MQAVLQDEFRCDPADRESREQLSLLLRGFGVELVEHFHELSPELIDNLIWRKSAAAVEQHGGFALHVFLDMGEGDEVLLATIRAGEISAFRFSHVE
jgi:hypothetical protein